MPVAVKATGRTADHRLSSMIVEDSLFRRLRLFLLPKKVKAAKQLIFYFNAAAINPLNNGCGLLGRDFSSGCAWVARKNG